MNHQQLTRALHHGEISAGDLISTQSVQSLFDSREPSVLAFIPEENRFERLRKDADELISRFPDSKNRPPLFGMFLFGRRPFLHLPVGLQPMHAPNFSETAPYKRHVSPM